MTPATLAVLQALRAEGPDTWGLRIVKATGAPSGSVYPILERLERAGWIESRWEDDSARPGARRRLYRFSAEGATAAASGIGIYRGRERPRQPIPRQRNASRGVDLMRRARALRASLNSPHPATHAIAPAISKRHSPTLQGSTELGLRRIAITDGFTRAAIHAATHERTHHAQAHRTPGHRDAPPRNRATLRNARHGRRIAARAHRRHRTRGVVGHLGPPRLGACPCASPVPPTRHSSICRGPSRSRRGLKTASRRCLAGCRATWSGLCATATACWRSRRPIPRSRSASSRC